MAARRTHNSTANLDPYRVPWFADCAPSLLTNRTIRRYLDAYSEHKWPEVSRTATSTLLSPLLSSPLTTVCVCVQVIKLTLIYGVLGLEQQFPGGSPSIAQLRALVEKGGAQLVVERNLPGLQRQILNLQTGLDAVFDRLAVEVGGHTPHAAASAGASKARVLSTAWHLGLAGRLGRQHACHTFPLGAGHATVATRHSCRRRRHRQPLQQQALSRAPG